MKSSASHCHPVAPRSGKWRPSTSFSVTLLLLRLLGLLWNHGSLCVAVAAASSSATTFRLPDTTLTTPQGLDVALNDIQCRYNHHESIQQLNVQTNRNHPEPEPRDDDHFTEMAWTIYGLFLPCTIGQVMVKWNGMEIVAHATMDLVTNQALRVVYHIPHRAKTEKPLDECQANGLQIQNLQLQGLSGIFATAAQQWQGHLQDASLLQSTVCEALQHSVPSWLERTVWMPLSKELMQASNKYQSNVSRPPLPPKPENASSMMVDLNSTQSSVEWVVSLVWPLIGTWLDVNAINSWIRTQILNSNTNASSPYYTMPVNYTMHDNATDWSQAMTTYGVDALSISSMELEGLDSLVEWKDIRPTSSSTLQTTLVWDSWTVAVKGALISSLNVNHTNTSTAKHYSNHTILTNNRTIRNNSGVWNHTTGTQSEQIYDDFVVKVALTNLHVTVDLRLELWESRLQELRMASLLGDNLTDCFRSALRQASLWDLRINHWEYANHDTLAVVQDLDDAILQAALNGLLDFVTKHYAELLPTALPQLMRDYLLQNPPSYTPFHPDNHTACQAGRVTGTGHEHLDYRELLWEPTRAELAGATGTSPYGTQAPNLKTHLDEKWFAGIPRPRWNDILPSTLVTEGQYGSFQDTLMLPDGKELDLRVELEDLRVDHLNTWKSPLKIADPRFQERAGLDNMLQTGQGSDPPLQITTTVRLKIGDGRTNDLKLTLEAASTSLVSNMILRVMEDLFLEYRLGDVRDTHCLLSMLEQSGLVKNDTVDGHRPFHFNSFDLRLEGFKMGIVCDKCRDGMTRVIMEPITGVLQSIFGGDGVYVHMGVNDIDQDMEERNVVTEFFKAVESRSFVLRDFADQMIVNSRKQCKTSIEYDPEAKLETEGLLSRFFDGIIPEDPVTKESEEHADPQQNAQSMVAFLCITGLVLCSWMLWNAYLRYVARQRQQNWVKFSYPRSILALRERQKQIREKDAMLSECCGPLYYSDEFPRSQKQHFVAMTVVTIALFWSGYLNTAGAVRMEFYVNASLSYTYSMNYSLASIVEMTWGSGGRMVAIVLALATGIWPVVRQVMMLALMFVPPNKLAVQKRGRILRVLDYLGKWSMIVVFINAFNVAAFRTTAVSQPDYILPFRVEIMYIPAWAAYATFFAQLLSHCLTRVILQYHVASVASVKQKLKHSQSGSQRDLDRRGRKRRRSIDEGATYIESGTISESGHSVDDNIKRSRRRGSCLSDVSFCQISTNSTLNESSWLQLRPQVHGGLLLLAFGIVLPLFVASLIAPSFTSKIYGMLNALTEVSAIIETRDHHNMFTLMRDLFAQAADLNQLAQYLGLGLMAGYIFVSLFAAPLFWLLTALGQWFLPLTESGRQRVLDLQQFSFSIQSVEVYLVSVLVFAWQMDDLAYYMIYSTCDAFEPLFELMATYGWVSWNHASECFGLEGSVGSGSVVLQVSWMLLWGLSYFVVQALLHKELEEDTRTQERSMTTLPEASPSPEQIQDAVEALQPFPVLFTDRFRWCLEA